MNPTRTEQRLAAYRRLDVPEVRVWSRTGGTDARPEGTAVVLISEPDGWREAGESAAVPGVRPRDLEELLREPDDIARSERADALAVRLAPAFSRRYVD